MNNETVVTQPSREKGVANRFHSSPLALALRKQRLSTGGPNDCPDSNVTIVQVAFTDSSGKPTLLGNSVIECENAGVPLAGCCTLHFRSLPPSTAPPQLGPVNGARSIRNMTLLRGLQECAPQSRQMASRWTCICSRRCDSSKRYVRTPRKRSAKHLFGRPPSGPLRRQKAADALEGLLNALHGERADLIQQVFLVHGEKLRDHDDALLRQVRFALFEENIPRNSSSAEIGRQSANDHGIDRALIEGVILYHHAGAEE